MKNTRFNKAFTLLEILVVIMIIGIMVTLALPGYVNMIENSRAHEALNSLGFIRRAMVRCEFTNNGYTLCTDFNVLDIEDPSLSPGAHFSYAIVDTDVESFTLEATRNTRANGNGVDIVRMIVDNTGVVVEGTGAYSSLENIPSN